MTRYQRWWQKMRTDPIRWGARMEDQRLRRSRPAIRQREAQQERDRWAKLPSDHHRKTRKTCRNPETHKACQKRYTERLPDAVVANRYLHMTIGECPKELIQLKREHIRLSRTLKTSIKTL